MSKNKLGPRCAKLRTARNKYSLDVSHESYAKNAIHLGNLNGLSTTVTYQLLASDTKGSHH